MLEKAFYGGKKYWALLAFLGLLIAAGVVTFLFQLSRGLTITGLSLSDDNDNNWQRRHWSSARYPASPFSWQSAR